MNDEERRALALSTVSLVEGLQPSRVIPALITAQLFTLEDHDEIMARRTRREQVIELIKMAETRGPRAFEILVSVLRRYEHEHLASVLHSHLLALSCVSRRQEVTRTQREALERELQQARERGAAKLNVLVWGSQLAGKSRLTSSKAFGGAQAASIQSCQSKTKKRGYWLGSRSDTHRIVHGTVCDTSVTVLDPAGCDYENLRVGADNLADLSECLQSVSTIDAIVFCVPLLGGLKLRRDDALAALLLPRLFPQDRGTRWEEHVEKVWRKVVVALTRSHGALINIDGEHDETEENRSKAFERLVDESTTAVQSVLVRYAGVKAATACSVPFVPVGGDGQPVPSDRRGYEWSVDLDLEIVRRSHTSTSLHASSTASSSFLTLGNPWESVVRSSHQALEGESLLDEILQKVRGGLKYWKGFLPGSHSEMVQAEKEEEKDVEAQIVVNRPKWLPSVSLSLPNTLVKSSK